MDLLRPINRDLLDLSASDLDTREVPGVKHNPTIVQWLRNAGITWGEGADETAWCSAYMYDLVGRVQNAPRPETRRASARSWLEVGRPITLREAKAGDVVIFDRGRGRGHIGLFMRQKGRDIVTLGGNQGNRVWPRLYNTHRTPILGIRRLYVEQTVPDDLCEWGKRLRAVQDEGLELFSRKNADYGNSFLAHGIVGTLIRSQDKLNRLQSVTSNGINLVDTESVRDTLVDLQNYASLGVALLDNGEA